MMVMKRKEILIGVLIVLIGVAGYVNWSYTKDPLPKGQSVAVPQDEQTNGEEEFGEHSTQAEQNEETQARRMGEAQYVSAGAGAESFFAEARISRESSRSKAIETLNGIVNNPNSDAQSKKTAQDKIIKLASVIDKETAAENIIKAKGFEEAVVFVNDDTATVTVKTEGLSATDMAKIQDIVTSQTGVSIKNIKIVEVK